MTANATSAAPLLQAPMSNNLRRCQDCGQPLGNKDLFCPRCGAKQPRDPKGAKANGE